MSDRIDEELELLRERAYGPNADIRDDPSALQRLRHLEGHGATVEELLDGVEKIPLPDPAASGSPIDTDTERPTSSAYADEPRTTTPRPTPIAAALALAGAAILAVITSATTAAIVRAESPYADVQFVTSLPAQDNTTWPSSLGEPKAGDKRYADFLGYTVFFRETTSETGAGTDCLSVLTPDNAQRDPARGAVVTTCGAAAFPPATTLVVSETSPPSVLNYYRIGTVLQFVQNGSRVDVYADPVLG